MSEEPPVSVSTEDVQAQPRRTGRSRVDLILAVTAIFLSAVSLFVAMENSQTQREMVSASTWPFPTTFIKIGANEHGDVVLGLVNAGVGPAKLQSFEVFYKGKPVTSALDLLRRCCGLSADGKAAAAAVNGWLYRATVDDVVLRVGEELPAITVRPNPKDPQLAERFGRALSDITYQGGYCSVLDECWSSDFAATRATKVKQCPAPAHPFHTADP